jgi:hypothetical protein
VRASDNTETYPARSYRFYDSTLPHGDYTYDRTRNYG